MNLYNKIGWCDATWKSIPNFDNYFASKNGEILSTKREVPLILSKIKSNCGHLYVFLYRKGGMYKMWVHRLVLMAWDRQPRIPEECRHLNGVSTDNTLDNLVWGSRQDNIEDRRKHGVLLCGERSPTHKLTESAVIEIRSKIGQQSLRSLGKEYGVSHTAIRRAALGIKWSCLKEGL